MENILLDTMYRIPTDESVCKVQVTEECVNDGAQPELYAREDGSKRKPVASAGGKRTSKKTGEIA